MSSCIVSRNQELSDIDHSIQEIERKNTNLQRSYDKMMKEYHQIVKNMMNDMKLSLSEHEKILEEDLKSYLASEKDRLYGRLSGMPDVMRKDIDILQERLLEIFYTNITDLQQAEKLISLGLDLESDIDGILTKGVEYARSLI